MEGGRGDREGPTHTTPTFSNDFFCIFLSMGPRSHLHPPDQRHPGELTLILASLGLKTMRTTIGSVRLLSQCLTSQM